MKKKNLFLLAVAALVGLASCTSDVTEGLSDASKRADGPFPVTFEAYTQRGTTRAGAVGELTTTLLKDGSSDFATAGFGVFGYYTNADDYASGSTPNFMYNQQVKYDGSAFTYSPLRYWPNEYGQTAQSEDIDKVSFFAYAPYVEVDPKTGYLSDPGTDNEAATWGITGTTRNTYTGDPLVKYIASFESGKSVDLCWGVYNEGSSGWSTMNGKQTTTDGLPWLNVQHAQSVAQKLKFTFRHATAKLTVNVDTKYDDTTTPADDATKVYVRSVTFTGMAAQGALNLNNAKAGVPLWMNYSGTGWPESGQSVTVYDGRRDGYEGTSGAEASNETTLGLNPTIISDDGNTTDGVTGDDDVSLFEGSSVYVIPTGEKVKLTIVYDVETAVPNLPGYLSDGTTPGTSIENRITKELMLDGGTALTFEGGKSYTLNLHLGLNSVQFDATVGDWDADQTVVPTPPAGTPPAGTLTAGKFSVAADKQVYFSQGNLQATTTDYGLHWDWEFAANQWDYIGDAPGNNSINVDGTLSTENGTFDLFGWVGASSTWTGATMYGISNSNTNADYGNIADESLKSDWGTLMGSGWYTLSKDEWIYLFNTRIVNGGSGSGHSYTIGQSVNGVLGVVIYPDGYTGSVYGGTNWSDFESAGCVFLPAAGSRYEATVYDVGTHGRYFSSSPHGTGGAHFVYFNSGNLSPDETDLTGRVLGFSVRLVHPVE